MNSKSISGIKDYWNQKAAVEGDDPNFTLPDFNLRQLEAEYIIRHLQPEDKALDIGCGNGATTLRFAQYVRQIIGGDYSNIMIEKARKLHSGPNIDYRVLDVMDIDVPDTHFDCVITERCLINLPDWTSQQSAIREIARILKPGGRLLLCESFEEAFVKFAKIRQSFGLEPMKRHWNNYLISEETFRVYVSQFFKIISVEKMGLYYLISRIVHPLLVYPQEPKYDNDINKIAVHVTLEMDHGYLADISVNGLYVLEKR